MFWFQGLIRATPPCLFLFPLIVNLDPAGVILGGVFVRDRDKDPSMLGRLLSSGPLVLEGYPCVYIFLGFMADNKVQIAEAV